MCFPFVYPKTEIIVTVTVVTPESPLIFAIEAYVTLIQRLLKPYTAGEKNEPKTRSWTSPNFLI